MVTSEEEEEEGEGFLRRRWVKIGHTSRGGIRQRRRETRERRKQESKKERVKKHRE